jgi:hypothetical protein
VTVPRQPVPRRRRAKPRPAAHRGRPSVKAVAQGFVVVVGLAGTLVGLVFAVWPSIKPEGPALTKGATLEHLSADEVITRRQYFQRAQLPTTGFTVDQLARRGLYVTFDISIEGYKGRELLLRWELVNATTGNQMADAESTIFKPVALRDAASWQEWIPLPSGNRTYVVFVRLYDPTGRVPLATQRSGPIVAQRT